MSLPWDHFHVPKPGTPVLTLESWAQLRASNFMFFTCKLGAWTLYLSRVVKKK